MVVPAWAEGEWKQRCDGECRAENEMRMIGEVELRKRERNKHNRFRNLPAPTAAPIPPPHSLIRLPAST